MTEFFISLGTLFTEYQSIIIPYPFLPSLTCLLQVTSMPPPPPSTRITMRWRHPTGHHIERVSIAPPRRNYATSRKPSLPANIQNIQIFRNKVYNPTTTGESEIVTANGFLGWVQEARARDQPGGCRGVSLLPAPAAQLSTSRQPSQRRNVPVSLT